MTSKNNSFFNYEVEEQEAENNFGLETQDDKKKKPTTQTQPTTPTSQQPEQEEYIPTPDEWLDIEGRRLKIPRNLRHSIFQFESGKRQFTKSGQTLTSPKNAQGYTQILPDTAKGEGYDNTAANVYDNISAGASYLRRGFDEAKKKGYDDETSWRMATRGYLNGQHRQEQTLSDGNVNTDQYEENVFSNWEKRINELGEREDDWNDPEFYSPLENLEDYGLSSEGTVEGAVEGATEQTVDSPAQEIAGKADETKVWNFLYEKYGEQTATDLINKMREKKDYTVEDVEAAVTQHEKTRDLTEEEISKVSKTVGEKAFKAFSDYLVATDSRPSINSFNEWVKVYNQQIKADPTLVKIKSPLAKKAKTFLGETALSEEEKELPVVEGKNRSEVAVNTFLSAAGSNGDVRNPAVRAGWELFLRQRGITSEDYNDSQKRHALYQAYLKNVKTVESIGTDKEKVRGAALQAISQMAQTGSFAELDKPENNWIVQFGLRDKDSSLALQNNPEVLAALLQTPYGDILRQNAAEQIQAQEMMKQIQSGVVPDNVSYGKEYNYTKYWADNSNNSKLASIAIFRDIAASTGFSEEEINLVIDDNRELTYLKQLSTGKLIETPEDIATDSNIFSGNVIDKVTLQKEVVVELMNARKALSGGYSSLRDYKNAVTYNFTNAVRQVGVDAVSLFGGIAENYYKEAETKTGIGSTADSFSGGAASGIGKAAKATTDAFAGILDIADIISTSGTPFSKGSLERRLRDERIDDAAASAQEVSSKANISIQSLNRYTEKAPLSGQIASGIGEGVGMLIATLPIMKVHSATFGASAALSTAGENVYTNDDLGKVVRRMAWSALPFALGRGANAVQHTKFGEWIGQAVDRTASAFSKGNKELITLAAREIAETGSFATRHADKLSVGIEELVQLPLPAIEALSEVYLTDKGRKLQKDFQAIQGGQEIVYPKGVVSEEDRKAYREAIVEEYKQLNADLTAASLTRDMVIAASIPFFTKGQRQADIDAVSKMGKVNLLNGRVYTSRNTDGSLEFSGYVQMPSGRTEFMVLPETVSEVREAVVQNKAIPMERETINSLLLMSRLSNRVGSDTEYQNLAKKLADTSSSYIEATNPVLTEQAKENLVINTENALRRQDAEVQKYIGQKQAELEDINRGLDETAKRMIAEEQQKAAAKEKETADRIGYIEEINEKLKDRSLSPDDQAGLLEDRRVLLAEQVRESQFVSKESTQVDFSERMLEVAQKVNADIKVGKDYGKPDQFYKAPSDQLLKDMADHLQDSPDAANDPRMKASYTALKKETKRQYQSLVDQGFKFEAYKGEGEPYKNSSEMLADLRNNKHLFYFATESGFGKEGEVYNHPLMADSGLKDSAGNMMLENDVFRAVHDALGHGVAGVQFGARGEHNATISHSRNYSDKALPALLSETSFQNAWVNYGKHLRNKKGDIPKKGEEGFIPATQRPFADQKVVNVTEDWVARWKAESDIAGSETVEYSRKAYEGISKRVEKGEVFSVKELTNADQKRALARLVGEKKAFISKKGEVISANLPAKEKYLGKLSDREAELRSIERSADLLAEIPESAVKAAESSNKASETVSKEKEGTGSASKYKKQPEGRESGKATVSLVGQKVKFKDSNKLVDVKAETPKSVVDQEGNVISKELLDLPKVSEPEAKAVQSEKAVDFSDNVDVAKKQKINLQSDDFLPNNPKTVILKAKDNTLVVNEAVNRKLEEAAGAKFVGLSLSKEEAFELAKRLNNAGHKSEAEAIRETADSLKAGEGIIIANGSNARKGKESVEFTTAHEFIHEHFRKAFKSFNKSVLGKIEKSDSFQMVKKGLEKAGYVNISTEDAVHEVLAHGLTFDIGALQKRGISPEIFAKATADVIDALSKEYSNKKVADIVDAVLNDITTFEENVRLNAAVVKSARDTISKEAEKAGVIRNEKQPIGQSKDLGDSPEAVRQAIADSNAAEPFIVIKNQPDYRQESGGRTGQRTVEETGTTGLKKIPQEKVYSAEESELFQPKRDLPVMKEEEVREFLSTDAASVKIMDKGHQIKNGQKIGVRLNLNVLKTTGKMIQTIHNKNYNGEALAYQQYVTVRDAFFNVNQKARELIASGQQNKFPMASVDGKYVKTDMPDFSGIEISFNPKVNHLFVDATGRPIKSAEEAVVIGSRVYARGKIEYYTPEDMPQPVSPSNVRVEAPFSLPEAPIGLKKLKTDTPNFKNWFGNSVLKDEGGNPRVLSHGTPLDFDTFNSQFIWVSDDRQYYDYYSGGSLGDVQMELVGKFRAAKTVPVFAKAENTFDSEKYMSHAETDFHFDDLANMFRKAADDYKISEDQRFLMEREIEDLRQFLYETEHEFNFTENKDEKPFFIWYNANPEIKSILSAMGFDSMRTIEGGGYEAFALFNPNQVKSAIGNNGDFSLNNMSILFKRIDEGIPVQPSDLAGNYSGVLTPEKAEAFGLKKVDTESENFKKWHGKSEAKDVLYHGTKSDIEIFSRTRIKPDNLGFHIGTLEQAEDFAVVRTTSESGEVILKVKDKAAVMPVYIRAENPLILQDKIGNWSPSTILNQLESLSGFPADKGELDNLRQRVRELNSFYGIEERQYLYYEQSKIILDYIKSKGYDSIKYLNRFEGFIADADKEITVEGELLNEYYYDKATMTDEAFQKKYEAQYSYLLFEPNQIKSAISNSGEFSNENMSILFKRREDDPEVHDLTISRLTQSGDPFTFTGKTGAEHQRRVQMKADPVFNFFVKDEDLGYSFEVEFGKKDKPHAAFKQFETKGAFRLYDVYQDYMPDGRRLWAELGDANAMRKIRDEGYDGFWNSNPDVSPTFRNRIALFDTPANRQRILSGDTSRQPTADERIAEEVVKSNTTAEEKIKLSLLKKSAESQIGEEINQTISNNFDVDLIDFQNEAEAVVVYDYVNSSDSSIRKVGDRNGISYRQVRNILRKYDVPLKPQVSTKNNISLTDEQMKFAIKAYTSDVAGERKSLTQLANRFGIDKEVMGRLLRKEGIQTDSAVISSRKSANLIYQSAKSYNVKFESPKGGIRVAIDSSFELAYMSMLDSDEKVESWTREIEPISYEFEGGEFSYFPDFIVNYSDGRKELVEVKPIFKTVEPKIRAKIEAGEAWAKENGYEFKVVTEAEIGLEGFAQIDINKVIGDPVQIKKLEKSASRAYRESVVQKELEKLRNAETEEQKQQHSTVFQIGLRKAITEKGDVSLSEKEREATDNWLAGFDKSKNKDKHPQSDLLVIAEGAIDRSKVVERNKNNADFTFDFMTDLSKKYGISDQLPKNLDTDSDLVETAMRGIAGKDWYQNSYDVLVSFKANSLGEFVPETFVRLVGATGQGLAPRENFIVAAKYLNRMLAGTYGKDNKKAAIEQLKATGILNGDGRYNIPASNISDAMNNIPLSTRKLGDYTEAFLGNPNKVVADEWMNRLLTGKSGAPSPSVYDYIEGRVRHVARLMSITPTQAQAMLWVGYKQRVGEFVNDQLQKLINEGASPSEVESVKRAYERMNEGGDFADIADQLGLQDRIIPDFPTAAIVAKYKDQLIDLVAEKAMPKVVKGKPDETKLPEGKAVAYYYDMNLGSNSQARVIVDSVKLDQFLDTDPQMTDNFAAVYERLYLNTKTGTIPNRDLGLAADAVFRAAYWKTRGADIRKIDFNQRGITTVEKLKKLGMFKLDMEEPDSIYFSRLQQVVSDKMPNSASVKQVKDILSNSGLRASEVEWMGLDEFLSGKDKVTKAEVEEFLELNRIEITEVVKEDSNEGEIYITEGGTYARRGNTANTKYSEYTMEGGENYREFLLTLPEQFEVVEGQFNISAKNEFGGMKGGAGNKTTIETLKASYKAQGYTDIKITPVRRTKEGTLYKSSHWSEPNVVAHFRAKERFVKIGDENLRAFNVEEFQSDWGQEGRKKGYVSDSKNENNYEVETITTDINGRRNVKVTNKITGQSINYNNTAKTDSELISKVINDSSERLSTGTASLVPDMPFKKNWHELAFRRALKYAVDNGFEALTWNKGETNAEIFGLSKVSDRIDYSDSNLLIVYKDGKRLQSIHVLPEKLPEYIGEELSDRLLNSEKITSVTDSGKYIKVKSISGKKMTVGGQGMKGFYNDIMVRYANKFVKKFGAKVGTAKTDVSSEYVAVERPFEIENAFRKGNDVFVLYVPLEEGGQYKRIQNIDIAKGMLEEGESLFVRQNKEAEEGISGEVAMNALGIPIDEQAAYWGDLDSEARRELIDNYRNQLRKSKKELDVHFIEITPAMRDEIYQKPIALFKRKDEAQRVADLKNLDYGEWIDLATEISSNNIITQKEAQDIQDLVNNKDLEGLQKYVTNLNRETFLEFLSSMRRSGLLTGIKTTARNIISNTAFQALEEIARVPASVLDIAISTVARKERTIQGLSPVGLTRGLYKAATEGLKKAARSIAKGDNYFSLDDVHVARERTTGYRALRPLEMARNLVFRFMGAQDNVFRSFAEERAKYELAWLKAKENGSSVATEYANLDPVDLDKAAYAASVAVFQNDNKLNKAYQNWRGDRGQAIKFMLDLKLPFVKTPSNIFDRILDYSGIWGLIKIADSDKQKIKNVISDAETRRAFQFAMAKGMTGFALMTLGYSMYNAGILYGFNDETDQALKKAQELENSGAGHILVGGKWRDISSLSPIAMLFLTGATYARQKEKEKQALVEDRKTASEKAVNYSRIILSIAQASPFIKAGAETLNERSMGSPFAPENLLPVDSLVPSIVAEIAQTTDPVKRSTTAEEGFVNRIKNKTKARIPFLKETLPAQRDASGKEKQQPVGFDPFASKTDRSNEASKEVKRLDFNMPVPRKKEGESVVDYNERKRQSGDIVTEMLEKVVQDQGYKSSPDAVKKQMLKATGSIQHDLKPDERFHNIQVYVAREALRKELTDELNRQNVDMSEEDRKRLITSLFSKTLVSKSKTLEEAKEAFQELKNNPKEVLLEAVENWKEKKEDEEEENN